MVTNICIAGVFTLAGARQAGYLSASSPRHLMESMPSTTASAAATVLMLGSAFLHAAVNALVKVSADGLLTRGYMNAMACLFALPALFFVEPPTPDQWRVLALSLPVHALYPFVLVAAYRHGDLTATYPVARGVVPLAAAGISVALAGEVISPAGLVFLGITSAGIAAFAGHTGSLGRSAHLRSIGWALLTGLIVAVYTVIDAIGLRAGTSVATYIVWLLLLDGFGVAACVAIARRGQVGRFVAVHWPRATLAGVLGVVTYVLALVAFSMEGVVRLVALRETSIVFAAAIGSLVLGERFGWIRTLATLLVLVGAAGVRAVG
jgi:drug/metabolite transporter (DMT)-like permease